MRPGCKTAGGMPQPSQASGSLVPFQTKRIAMKFFAVLKFLIRLTSLLPASIVTMMKRVLTWLGCMLAVLCVPNIAWGKTEFPWVRGNVYAAAPDKSLALVVLPAWILSRAHVLSIDYLSDGKAEIRYVAERHRIAKEKISLPDDMRQAMERVMSSHKMPKITMKYLTSRTTHTPQLMIENGGTMCSLIKEKEMEIRKLPLQGIAQQGMVPEVCTLTPRDGKIAVLFHCVASTSPHYYLGIFEAASGRLYPELVPVGNDDVLAVSLLWLNDSTLAATAVGHNGGFWSILSLTSGNILASGSEKDENSNFIVLPEGLFVAHDDKTLKCLYRIRPGGS